LRQPRPVAGHRDGGMQIERLQSDAHVDAQGDGLRWIPADSLDSS
jgi:hypothetical protein